MTLEEKANATIEFRETRELPVSLVEDDVIPLAVVDRCAPDIHVC